MCDTRPWVGRSIVPFLADLEIFLFSELSRLPSETIWPSIQLLTEFLSPGVKLLERESDHSSLYTVEDNDTWSLISTPIFAFVAYTKRNLLLPHAVNTHLSGHMKWVAIGCIYTEVLGHVMCLSEPHRDFLCVMKPPRSYSNRNFFYLPSDCNLTFVIDCCGN
jgi:hypothetical protein